MPLSHKGSLYTQKQPVEYPEWVRGRARGAGEVLGSTSLHSTRRRCCKHNPHDVYDAWMGALTGLLPGTAGPQGGEDFREGYMAGPGGVPAGHAVAVEVAVVLLQLLQAVKPHKAVQALFLHAQKVLTPACRAKPLVRSS